MKPPPFTYHRPATVEEAARLLAELGDAGKVLAGGQSLVPLLNFRLAAPEHLVDINHVAGLDRVLVTDHAVEVGATVRDAWLLGGATATPSGSLQRSPSEPPGAATPSPALQRSPSEPPAAGPALVDAHPLLVEATRWIAHPVIRNRGTVCGSLAHADPAAELPAALALVDGNVEVVAWRDGALVARDVAAADLFAGPLQTTLAPDELVVRARFPRLPAGTGWAVEELARRHGDFALAGVALTVAVDDDGRPTAGRAAYMSCAPAPVVVDLTPALGPVAPDDRLYELVVSALDPTDDIHASGEYRRHLAAVLTTRALSGAVDRARRPPAKLVQKRTDSSASRTNFGGTTTTTDGVHEVAVTVNGTRRAARAPARRLLSDLLRHDLGLTGTHVGCEHGVCGACTVLVDGEPVRSCLTFAVSVAGAEVTTVEGLAGDDGELGPVQRAFRECHGLQCGFCTPGFLLLTTHLLGQSADPPDEDAIAEALGGNLCRCTGYVNIVRSVRRASELVRAERQEAPA